jgi:Double zinc ribbon
MAETHHCKRCGGVSPADARFCIDCGAPLAPAATGDTTRLPGMRCPSCATNNPEHARFCVVCGRGLVGGVTPAARPAPQPRPALQPRPPAMPPGPKGASPHSPRQHSYPRVASPPVVLPVAPRPPVVITHRSNRSARANGPLLFGVGLLILIVTGNIWPGILWLIGISGFVGAMTHGRGDKAFQALLWWGGLALLFASGTFWPGILLLVFLSMALGGHGRGKRGCW